MPEAMLLIIVSACRFSAAGTSNSLLCKPSRAAFIPSTQPSAASLGTHLPSIFTTSSSPFSKSEKASNGFSPTSGSPGSPGGKPPGSSGSATKSEASGSPLILIIALLPSSDTTSTSILRSSSRPKGSVSPVAFADSSMSFMRSRPSVSAILPKSIVFILDIERKSLLAIFSRRLPNVSNPLINSGVGPSPPKLTSPENRFRLSKPI